MHWEHCHLASCKRGTFLLAFGFKASGYLSGGAWVFIIALLPRNWVKGNRNLNFREIAQRKRGGNELRHPIATLGRVESDNSKVSRFGNVQAFRSFRGTGAPQPGWVSHSFLYKRLLWVRNGSLPSPQGHRMDIYIHGYLICLLLFLFHSETACHPPGKRDPARCKPSGKADPKEVAGPER